MQMGTAREQAFAARMRASSELIRLIPPQPISLLDHFAPLPDHRVVGRTSHLLLDIIAISICACICGAESWEQVVTYANDHRAFLDTFLALPNGVPSHDTFNRVFRHLDPEAFNKCFVDWLNAVSARLHLGPLRWHAAVDGKTARHSFDSSTPKGALHLLTAWASENGFTLGQMAVGDKSNEITGIPKLLEILYLEGAVVTIDAIGCQKKIAAKVREKKADYIFAVKENQPHLYEDVMRLFEEHWQDPEAQEGKYSAHEERSKGHGREEVRTCIVLNELEGIRGLDKWADAGRIAVVIRQCWEGDKYSVESRYFLGSYLGTAKDYLYYCRQHWGIENGQHYILDVTFREDDDRTRKDHGPENFALIRRIALTLLKQDKSTKMTTPTKRIHACGNDAYLHQILLGFNEQSDSSNP